jgi:hypothetical protein
LETITNPDEAGTILYMNGEPKSARFLNVNPWMLSTLTPEDYKEIYLIPTKRPPTVTTNAI